MALEQQPRPRGWLIVAVLAGLVGLLVAIVAVLFVVLSKNDNGGSTTAHASSSTKQANATSSISTRATTSATPVSVTRVVVGGIDRNVDGAVKCSIDRGLFTIEIGTKVGVVLTGEHPPRVKGVGIGVDGLTLSYDLITDGQGDTTLIQEGKTYKVSGHATALDSNNPSSGLQTVPYEIEATCP